MTEQMRQVAPFAVFLVAYLGYATVQVFGDGSETIVTQLVPIGLLGIMMVTIIWHGRQQDEVRQAIARQADAAGFWGTFLILYLVSTLDGFESALLSLLPLWAVPLVAWLAGYLWTIVRYR